MFLELLQDDAPSIANVENMFNKLLDDPNLLSSMTLCEFLGVSSRFAHAGITVLKEGRCHSVLLNKTTYERSLKRRGCRFLCFTMKFDWNFCNKRKNNYCDGEKRWVVLTPEGIALFHSPVEKSSTNYILFDQTFSVWINDRDECVVKGSNAVLNLTFSDAHEARDWVRAINQVAVKTEFTKTHKHGSFAPQRLPSRKGKMPQYTVTGKVVPPSPNGNCQWLIDGETTFKTMYKYLLTAKKEIFICEWWMSLDIPLDRSSENPEETTLFHIIKKKAINENVQVYVLLYKELSGVTDETKSYTTAERLKHMGSENIHVLRHRSRFSMNILWSHHEKIISIDQRVAFLGGLDICPGRFDNHKKQLFERGGKIINDNSQDRNTFPDLDYRNPRLFAPSETESKRNVLPRMPWSDIHVCLFGEAATDVVRHVVDRWNYARMVTGAFKRIPATICRDKWWKKENEHEGSNELDLNVPNLSPYRYNNKKNTSSSQAGVLSSCKCQIVRSISRWSGGCIIETSIHEAYIKAIEESQHFIYIENQFFCTGCEGDEYLGNRIAEALRIRINRAHEYDEQFRVMVVLPLLPEGAGDCQKSNTPLVAMIHWQLSSISRSKRSLFEKLRLDGVDKPEQYIHFFSQRTYDVRPSDGKVFTSMIYVHSKAMIVDDRISIIGSANINDRSMLGIRDSEIAVVIEDIVGPCIPLGNNKKFDAGNFSHSLRMQLFKQMLGDKKHCPNPASNEGWDLLLSVAICNTAIYEDTFPIGEILPSNSIQTWDKCLKALKDSKKEEKHLKNLYTSGAETDRAEWAAENKRRLNSLTSSIQGTLVEYPIHFLNGEKSLEPRYHDVASSIAPSDLFN